MKALIKILFLVIVSLYSYNIVHSQSVAWTQSFSPAELNNESNVCGNYIAISDNNELYFSGLYNGSIDFDFGPDTSILTSSGVEGYLLKLDTNGVLVWAKKFEGSGYFTPDDIIVDHADNLYMIGTYFHTVDVDPGLGVTNMVSNGVEQVALLKIDGNGDLIWAKQIGDNSSSERCYALTIDNNNDIIVSGRFSEQMDIDPGPATQIIDAGLSIQSFIIKLDPDGNLQWYYHTMGGNDNSRINILDIATDIYGNIYATGWFRDSVDFNPLQSSYYLEGIGFSDIFILKLSSSGNYTWAQGIGSNYQYSQEQGSGIIVDDTCNVYITGLFRGNVDFDNGPNVNQLVSPTSESPFILKLDSVGGYKWAQCLLSSYLGRGSGIELDSDNSIIICGYFHGSIDCDPGPNNYNFSSNIRDGFISKYTNNGNFLWAHKIGSSSNDEYISIIKDHLSNLYLSGYFHYDVDFDPCIYDDIHSADSIWSGTFIQKWDDLPYTTIDSTICQNDTCIFYGTPLTQTGLYYHTETSILSGCDSIIEMNLTVCPNYYYLDSAILCQNDSIYWHGYYYDTIGNYYDSLLTINNCDSIFELFIASGLDFHQTDTVFICDGDSTLWHGVYYSINGIYNDTLQTVNGCDSIFQMQLILNPTYFHSDTFSVCYGDSILWQGSYIFSDSIYTMEYLTSAGCDSILQIDLNVYPIPIIDSILGLDTVNLNQNEIYYIINDTLFYYWNVDNGSIIQQPANNMIQILWDSLGIGHIYVVAENQYGCFSDTTILSIIIGSTLFDNLENDIMYIYPNPTDGHFIVPIYGFEKIVILNSNGQIVLETFECEIDISNLPTGIYYIKISKEEETITGKIIKE